jgi:four helix bundle protein
VINNFDKLKVLEKSHLFTLEVYKLVRNFPSDEKFRLIDQICRSSSSVPANIVEGNSRKTTNEFAQFLYQAKGSLSETQYHLLLAKDLKIIDEKIFNELILESDEIGKMISGLITFLKSK